MASKEVLIKIDTKVDDSKISSLAKSIDNLANKLASSSKKNTSAKKAEEKAIIATLKAEESLLKKQAEEEKQLNSLIQSEEKYKETLIIKARLNVKESLSIGRKSKELQSLSSFYAKEERISKANAVAESKRLKEEERDTKRIFDLQKQLVDVQSAKGKNIALLTNKIRLAKKANDDYAKSVLGISTSSKVAKSSQVELATAVNGSANQFRNATGLSGAFVTEIGRTAQDAAYGFNAVANNLSQMSTLFGAMVTDAKSKGGTLRNVFQTLGATFSGPTGIIVGLNVVIGLLQSAAFREGVANIFRATTAFGGLGKAIKEVSGEYGDMLANFEANVAIAQDDTRTRKEQTEAIKELNDEFGVTEEQITDLGDSFKVSEKAVKSFKDELVDLAISSAALNKLSEIQEKKLNEILEDKVNILNKRDELETFLNQKRKNSQDKLLKEEDIAYFKSISKRIANDELSNIEKSKLQNEAHSRYIDLLGKEQVLTGESVTQLSGLYDMINAENLATKDLSKTQDELNKEYGKTEEALKSIIKTTNSTKDETPLTGIPKDYKQKLKSFQEDIDKAREETKDKSLLTAEEIAANERDLNKKLLDNKVKDFKEKEAERLRVYKSNPKVSDAQKKEAEDLSKESINRAVNESIVLKGLYDEIYDKEINLINRNESEKAKNHLEEINRLTKEAEAKSRDFDVSLIAELGVEGSLESAELTKKFNDDDFNEKQAELEAELEAQEDFSARSIEIQDELNNLRHKKREDDLNSEIAINEAKANVAKAHVDTVRSLGGLLSSILEATGNKNKHLAKVALGIEKGAAIADVIINTARANAVITSLTSASAAAPGALTYSLAKGAKLRAFNNIKAGVSIASILATGLGKASAINNSESGGSSSAGGGATQQVQAPDFNIIGSTGTNQIANTIAETNTSKEPIKAYVVSQDITSTQELDRTIKINSEF